MRYNITRLTNEIIGYENEIAKLKTAYNASPEYGQEGCVRQDLSRELNSKRHSKSLCLNYIGNEVVQRIKEGKSLDDTHELEDWEQIRNLPVKAIAEDTARGFMNNAAKMAERVGYRVTWELHSKLLK